MNLEPQLEAVRSCVMTRIGGTPLSRLSFDFSGFICGGKMLRSRAALRLAPTLGLPEHEMVFRAAAVELCHAASLLHDDVIDGGRLRRHAPSFWVQHGVSGSILTGDMLWALSLGLLDPAAQGSPRDLMVDMNRMMCEAEVEQDMLLRDQHGQMTDAERIARGKTGALFAFVAAASAPVRGAVFDHLLEAGFLAGIAYQFSDDILDIEAGASSGKEGGLDRARKKITAASANGGGAETVRRRIRELEAASRRHAAATPAGAAWEEYWDRDLRPAMEKNMAAAG